MKRILIYIAAIVVPGMGAAAQNPLVLSQAECRQMALAHNEELKKADNALRQAELDKAIAFTAYLPKFDAMASGTYVFPDLDMMGAELQMRGMYFAGITLTQPIYAGGRIMAGNKLAKIGRECAAETQRKTRMEVIADADHAYWTFIAVERKVRMLETYSRQMEALYRQAEVSVAAEMGTENDLLRITTKRSEIEYQLQKARNGSDLCRLALCNVLGKSLDTEIVPTDTVISVAAPTRMDESIAERPELKLLQMQVGAQQEQIKSVRADILPMVGLSAGYSYYGNVKMNGVASDGMGGYVPYTQKFQDGFGLAMLSVNIPLFHWGEGLKKVKKARLDLQNAELDLQRNTRLLSIEVRQAVQNVTDGYRMVETAELGCRQADENLRVMQGRYDASMCTLTDLLDAQSQWQQSQSNYIEAQTQYKIYETEYLRATGRLE
ncbi:MAG: TolC family protein [Bacteroidales bacterium]|nr:TolC family protein [Bacteroidales bacterium]